MNASRPAGLARRQLAPVYPAADSPYRYASDLGDLADGVEAFGSIHCSRGVWVYSFYLYQLFISKEGCPKVSPGLRHMLTKPAKEKLPWRVSPLALPWPSGFPAVVAAFPRSRVGQPPYPYFYQPISFASSSAGQSSASLPLSIT